MNILKRVAIVLGGIAWFALVFFVSLWMTFPRTAVAEWVRFRVQDGSKEKTVLMLDSLAPSGFGVRGDGVALYKAEGRGDKAKFVPMFDADTVWVRIGPWSLMNIAALGGEATIRGAMEREGNEIDFTINVGRMEKTTELHGLYASAEDLPLTALPEISGAKLIGTGGFDLDISLDAPEGLSEADGHISLSSPNLVITKVDAPGTMLEGLDLGAITISKLDIAFDVGSGKAKVSRGDIVSDLVQAEVQGDIVLKDDLMQSQLRLKVLLTLGDSLQAFKGFLGDAFWEEDSRYHYSLTGTMQRPRWRPDPERKARAVPSGTPKMTDTPARPTPERAVPSLEDRERRPRPAGFDDPIRPPPIEDDGMMPPPDEIPNDVPPPPPDFEEGQPGEFIPGMDPNGDPGMDPEGELPP